jgi:hypothetical protein
LLIVALQSEALSEFLNISRNLIEALGPWLPDGLLTNQNFSFGYILEGLGMENFAITYGHLEYLTAIWYTL